MARAHDAMGAVVIERAITPGGRVGFDRFGQLMLATPEGEWTTYTFVRDLRGLTCPICLRVWEATGDSLADQTHWDLIDERVHASCLERHYGFVERARIQSALIEARIRFTGLRAIPNGYWPSSQRPWYQLDALDWPVRFSIGWRKRVIEISLEPIDAGPDVDVSAMESAFADADVTKNFDARHVLIHAWGYESLRDYLGRIRIALEKGEE